MSLVVGDFNGDGKVDVAVADNAATDGRQRLLGQRGRHAEADGQGYAKSERETQQRHPRAANLKQQPQAQYGERRTTSGD